MLLRFIQGLLSSAMMLTILIIKDHWEMLTWPPSKTVLLFGSLALLELTALALVFSPWARQWMGGEKSFSEPEPSTAATLKEIEKRMQAEAIRIEQRSRVLADRTRVIHEWMDYPQMLDLQTGSHLPGQPPARQAAYSSADLKRIAEQDAQVREILETQAEVIYEKVRKNVYSPAGTFQPLILRDDLVNIAIRIAQVYQPQLTNPLLSTTPEQLARALNRIGLHLLVVMDQLPLDLKSYNIQKTYDTIRRAINTYGAYRKASPYLDWASKGVYFGRMVTSTNPLALGLLWGATELGKYGAQKLATHLIDRQAIGFLQSVIRVVGYEVAAIYGGDFRHRDSNWCYAVELTQLLATFPASRESVQYGLLEIGRLQLRNEYDRLAVYRAVASGKAIDRSQTYPDLLTESERRKIVELLEKAYQDAIHGRGTTQADKWKKGVQEHLGMKLSLKAPEPRGPKSKTGAQETELLRFMIGYLRHIKLVPADKLEHYLIMFELPGTLKAPENADDFEKLLRPLLQQASLADSFDFLPPDLEPTDPRVDQFLRLLCSYNATITPYSPESEQMLLETGFYYRKTYEALSEQIYLAYQRVAEQEHQGLAPLAAQAGNRLFRSLLYLQSESRLAVRDVVAAFPQPRVTFDPSGLLYLPEELHEAAQEYHLVVLSDSLLLIRAAGLENYPEIVWQADPTTRIDNTSSLITAEATLTGGLPANDYGGPPVNKIVLTAPMTARFQHYFAPLISRIPAAGTTLSKPNPT